MRLLPVIGRPPAFGLDGSARTPLSTPNPVLSGLRRLFAAERLSVPGPATAAAVPFMLVFALGLADGGFFPRPWSWATLGLAATAVCVLVLRRQQTVSRRPLLLLGALAALGAWIAASLWWTRSVGLTIPELQRLLLYLAGVGVAVLLARAHTARALVGGVFGGTAAVTVWGLVAYLATRDAAPDVFQGSYLNRPMGYANAMAIVSVIALLLGLGIATDASSRRARAAAAVTLVPLASALALTGSRAALATLFLGAGVGLGLAPDRARLLDAWRWIVPLPALTVLGVSVVDPTDSRIVGDAADQLGNRLLVFIALFTALAVPPALIASRDRPRRVGHRTSRRLWGAAAVLGVIAVVAVGVARTPTLAGDRPTFWRVAAGEFEQQPLLGSGAGTYAQVWLERRPVDSAVRDAHSIVIETASDLGIVGLLLVGLVFAPPLLWALRARGQPLAPAAGGAFAAYAAHASVDWDWEMPAVTLAGLFCAVALGALADNDRRASRLGAEARGAALVLSGAVAAVALVGLAGASASEDASRSLARGDPARAEQAARRAERWQPWAAEPLLLQGQARVALDDPTEARALFARAAARDPNDYRTWLALASVSRGEAARIAVLRARALNPRAVRDISASTSSKQNSRFTKRRKEGA